MLDANIAGQLKTYMERLAAPIELVASLDGSARAVEMRKLLEQVAAQPTRGKPASGPQLTEREGEVIRLVAQGKSNREIAKVLVISEKTAKAHISNMLGKLGLEDRTQMAVFAIKNGLVDKNQL